ncbi:Ketosamine-3-kinase [Trametopsis cervina]|nr:Ketosamine-3-kinase [Trametopsis cervina]
MNVHPVIARAIKRHEDGARVEFHTNEPFVRSSNGKAYFTKIGSTSERKQFVGEAEALRAMHTAAPGLAPRLIECGVIDEETSEHQADVGKPYFVSEYKKMSSLTNESATKLAKRLATELHTFKSTNGFGFAVPTFCGRTKQDNGWYGTWEQCYDALIGGLLDKLKAEGGYSELCSKGEQVRKRVIPALLGPLIIQPVLLHGDLWSGNTGTDLSSGEPVIFDPSAYFGHNEADLAIARIFGGIPKSFFHTYHEYLPKTEPEDQYELRGALYELYHYLNHTVMFGGSYAGSAEARMDTLLKAVPA